jgi:hypothetical protein
MVLLSIIKTPLAPLRAYGSELFEQTNSGFVRVTVVEYKATTLHAHSTFGLTAIANGILQLGMRLTLFTETDHIYTAPTYIFCTNELKARQYCENYGTSTKFSQVETCASENFAQK